MYCKSRQLWGISICCCLNKVFCLHIKLEKSIASEDFRREKQVSNIMSSRLTNCERKCNASVTNSLSVQKQVQACGDTNLSL